jgi:hypothetical protein
VWQFGQQLEVWAVQEDGVVGDEWEVPSDRRAGDPQVADMLLLVERVTQRAALVAQPGVGPGGLVVDRQHPTAVQQRSTASSRRSPQPAATAP